MAEKGCEIKGIEEGVGELSRITSIKVMPMEGDTVLLKPIQGEDMGEIIKETSSLLSNYSQLSRWVPKAVTTERFARVRCQGYFNCPLTVDDFMPNNSVVPITDPILVIDSQSNKNPYFVKDIEIDPVIVEAKVGLSERGMHQAVPRGGLASSILGWI
ncbi:hypothetical protein VNO78_16023 [Psophocarpus tetragonolobus]|uniref:Uncharacterized protein n=1 Tax=Psophocarpus tetragonolobus TaxID=3891 RepID=A0AAN9SH36_PSOTE